MNTEQLAVVSPKIHEELAETRVSIRNFFASESKLREAANNAFVDAWIVGGHLAKLKEQVGHGNWLLWLPANLPVLGQNDSIITETASRCIRLFNENPNIGNSRHLTPPKDFTIDSRRKFMWNYIPQKERPALEGDSKDIAVPHPLTFVNYWHKWTRGIKTGQIQPLPIEILRHDLCPMLIEGVEMVGKEYFFERLNGNGN